jgi:N-acetylglucosaminyldiphosphoundecaprenol N-acetyl-beta-D-mannosaminyltransferase
MGARCEQILGIGFFNGTARAAVARMQESGGLLVAPSGTCFERFTSDADYRRAILTADVVLPDSGLMVTLWRLLRRRRMHRVSGLAYLKELLSGKQLREGGTTLWILPNESSRTKLIAWSPTSGVRITPDDCYIAPIYQTQVRDDELLKIAQGQRPRHIVIGIGAGAQEKLGWYLRENAGHRPSIHCIGGALGILTGDQRSIPDWADRFYLGWLFRLLSQPRVFVPRLWKARLLPFLLFKYGSQLPPLSSEK